ncbi:uncharacterized protein LOC144749513 [Ciona intestinalis]
MRRDSSPIQRFPGKQGQIRNRPTTSCVGEFIPSTQRFRLKVVPVFVWGEDKAHPHRTLYAFLDEGSDSTYCTTSLMRRLGLRGSPVPLDVKCLFGGGRELSRVVSLSIRGIYEDSDVFLPSVFAVAQLPSLESSIPCNDVVDGYEHLKGLEFPDPDRHVELLIGAGCKSAHCVVEQRIGGDNEPNAVRTVLGWALVGPEGSLQAASTYEARHTYNACCAMETLHQQMKQMFQQDFSEYDFPARPMSVEDKKALEKMEASVTKVRGHYQVALPWKDEERVLPDSREMALKRLMSLKKRFVRDPRLHHMYNLKMNEYLFSGYAVVVPMDCERGIPGRTWYVPHHATTGKFRIVFDCAAKYRGTSLNEKLLSGPDLTNSIVGTLVRFRKYKIAFTGDIKAMFHQVYVNSNDCDAFRFLWWENGDYTKQPLSYRMTVHIFGATSSPSCASFALRRTAKDNIPGVSEEAVESVMKNFYVDDLLKSVETEERALSLIHELDELLSSGGFKLTKYLSSSRYVMDKLNQSELSPSLKTLNVACLPTDKTLGIFWNTQTDAFEVKVNVKEKPATRRGLLSMASQVFDPLGFVQPFLLPVKRVMQQLCEGGIGWDQPIPQHQEDKWFKWVEGLANLESIRVPRWLGLCNTNRSVELHCFCDASELGYGAVCYFRVVSDVGDITCSFVMGKSRVAPLKVVTIPRLELCACVVGVKLVRQIVEESQHQVNRVILWTDSTSALQYIFNTTRRFQRFVANRLSVIHELSDSKQWRHVDSKRNPADAASRGLMPDKATGEQVNVWINGPSFLHQSEDSWPVRPSSLPTIPDSDPEVKKETQSHAAVISVTTPLFK